VETPRPDSTNAASRTSRLSPLIAAIQHRWPLLSEIDLEGVKTRKDLAAVIHRKYPITDEQAATDVEKWVVSAGS